MRERYGVAVGLSDHSGTIFPGLAAAAMGVEVIEVHIAMSREMFGPDVVASLTSAEFATLVRGVRFIESMRAAPMDKSKVHESAAPLRAIFLKSVVARMDLPAGTLLRRAHITTKKPGTGLPASEFENVIGRILARDVTGDVALVEEDFRGLKNMARKVCVVITARPELFAHSHRAGGDPGSPRPGTELGGRRIRPA